MFIGLPIPNSNDQYILFFNSTNILKRFCAKQKIYTYSFQFPTYWITQTTNLDHYLTPFLTRLTVQNWLLGVQKNSQAAYLFGKF